MPTYKDLSKARNNKQDEFYTQLSDIERELNHSEYNFENKIVLCNCDNDKSNFVKFFIDNFNRLKLKKLYATSYNKDSHGELITFDGKNKTITKLNGDGDFASEECIKYLDECDIVCTNPPFSLFGDYIRLLFKHGKEFVIIGNQVSISNAFIFGKMKNNELWFGYGFKGLAGYFSCPDEYDNYATSGQKKDNLIRVAGVTWFTTIKPNIRKNKFEFKAQYEPGKYVTYDGFDDIIETGSCKEIPDNYYGLMGVPITFMNKYNPEQFNIVGLDGDFRNEFKTGTRFKINGKTKFARIVVKRKKD